MGRVLSALWQAAAQSVRIDIKSFPEGFHLSDEAVGISS